MTSTDELGPVLSEALAAMEDGVAVFAEDDALVFANARFSALAERLGGSADVRAYADLCAAPGAEALPEASTGAVPDILLSGGELRCRLIPLDEGRALLILSDISAQVQAERLSRARADQLAAILEHVPHGVSYLGADGRLEVANDEFFSSFDFPPDLTAGTQGLDFTREILRRQTGLEGDALDRAADARLARIYRECENGAVSQDTEWLDDGRVIEIRRRLTPQGSLVETYIDVTDRENALEEAQRAVRQYRAVVEDQTEMICRFDPAFRLTFANSAYRAAFAEPGGEILGRSLFEILGDEALGEEIGAGLSRLSAERPVFTGTFRETTRQGDAVWQSWINRAIYDEDGALVEYQAVGRDVTAEREAREALSQAEKLSAMGSLLASVSHELNNPLSILVGQAQLLEERSEDPAVRERAELIKNAADRSARIVRTFLSMARQKPPVRVRIDLAELAREAVALVDYAFRTSSVEVEIETPPEPLIVEGDRDQLIQVVVNVLINAQQALSDCEDPRRVSIHVKAGEGRAVLMISDNGPGIDARMRERIFEPFFTTKPEGVGTGIGLAVSRNIATAHDGTLEVEAPPEGGAVFRLSLPVAASGETGGTEDETARIWRALPPLSVLFADDEPAIAMTARDVLEADGHRLLTAGNGREALDILRRDEVDVLITDLRMPVMDGMALWEELRRSGLHPTSAVGVVTGDTLGSEVRRFLEDTRVPVAEKPLSFDDLRKLIVEVVSTEV